MSPTENLHVAIGEIAYAVAMADGKVQKEEREKFHSIVEAELRCRDYDFDISDIIFQIMDKDNADAQLAYESAMKEIRVNSHYLSPQLKKTFLQVIEKVANVFPSASKEKALLIERFKKDIDPLKGDPIYYSSRV